MFRGWGLVVPVPLVNLDTLTRTFCSNTLCFPCYMPMLSPLLELLFTWLAYAYPSFTSWRSLSSQKSSLNHSTTRTGWHRLLKNSVVPLQSTTQLLNTALGTCMVIWSISTLQGWSRLANPENKNHLSLLPIIPPAINTVLIIGISFHNRFLLNI